MRAPRLFEGPKSLSVSYKFFYGSRTRHYSVPLFVLYSYLLRKHCFCYKRSKAHAFKLFHDTIRPFVNSARIPLGDVNPKRRGIVSKSPGSEIGRVEQ